MTYDAIVIVAALLGVLLVAWLASRNNPSW